MLAYQHTPCFARGRTVVEGRKFYHLSVNPWLLAILVPIEVVLCNMAGLLTLEDDKDDRTAATLLEAFLEDNSEQFL